jgi:hypothetical protein
MQDVCLHYSPPTQHFQDWQIGQEATEKGEGERFPLADFPLTLRLTTPRLYL